MHISRTYPEIRICLGGEGSADCMNTHEINMFNEKDLNEISVGSSSKGNQEKWYDTNSKYFIKAAFYYENKYWQDYLVEIIVSELAQQMKTGI